MNGTAPCIFSKDQALQIVQSMVGFPKPQEKYLSWYFCQCGDFFVPRVNFRTLAEEVRRRNLVEKMARVKDLKQHDCERQAVIVEIYSIIRKHMMHVTH